MKVKNVPLWTSHQTYVLSPKYLPSHTCSHSLFFFLVITMNDAPSSKLPFGNLKYYYKMVTGCVKIILATRTII